ncbi:enoyl-CoA hydratase-related protein [Plantactinospora sp. B5E13]|uniref:enoyl-CoA hydratase/isomerase family protein n=1 Tax=unclassified Plantactinospora TaxID=2631981 RepID=UPI00325E271D
MNNNGTGHVRVERNGAVARVVIDRPPVNAITLDDYRAITDVFTRISGSRDVHCVVLTAAGRRAFCAGLDLREFLASTAEEDPARALVVRATFESVRTCAVPVIAAVNGPALGAGAVLASVCDIRIAARSATIGLPEINVGRCGGGAYLGRLVPPGALRRIFFTGEPVDAEEAYRIGLFDEVVDAAELPAAADRLAARIAGKSPVGLRYGKTALNEVEGLPVERGYPIEQGYSTRLMMTEDAREAAQAVLEKRTPVWRGR